MPRKKKRKPMRPEGSPKRAMNAYMIFANQTREARKDEQPDLKATELISLLAKEWRAMSDKEKAPWSKLAEIDRLRYKEEMEKFKETLVNSDE